MKKENKEYEDLDKISLEYAESHSVFCPPHILLVEYVNIRKNSYRRGYQDALDWAEINMK